MTRLARFVVDKRGLFCILFLALIAFSVVSVRWVQVEEDITAYLPVEAEARRGLTIMEEEFLTYGTAQVRVKGVTPEEAQTIADELARVQDVVLVQYDETENHYRDGKALYDLTFADVTASERSEAALDAVKALLADRDTTIHSEVGFSLAALIAEQMLTVLIFVVIVVLAVLVFTSSTYAEVPVMILTFLTAAVINLGSHFLLGTISFVSNSVAIVLQLALSVDYAIILCNRYKEEHKTLGIREAVIKALAASIPEISASSLTTIAGLTAMTFMKFRLGVDMGVCLIKAILCSLLTVFLFMPCLLMAFGKAMDKTRHRSFVPRISFIGKIAYATRVVFPILFVALVVGGYLIFARTDYAYCVDIVPAFRQTEYEASQSEIRQEFGDSNLVAVLTPAGNFEAEKQLISALKACPEVESATGVSDIEIAEGLSLGDAVTYPRFAELAQVDETTAQALFAYYAAENGAHREAETDLEHYEASLIDLFVFLHDRVEAGEVELPEEQAALVGELYGQLGMLRSQLMSERHNRVVVNLKLPVQSEETFAFLDRIHEIGLRCYGEEPVLTGNSVSALGFRDSFASDNLTVGLMSLVLVMLILFFTFKSFGMPLLLILIIQGSIWLNFAIAALQGKPVFFLCYLIVSAIQMGANIDYAIVISSRYMELRETLDRREAIIGTLNLAFPTIITSGLMMVCAGLLIGFQVSQCIIAGMGYYVGTGTSISLCLILFALPQLLLLGDRFVAVTRVRPENSAVWAFVARNRRRVASGFLAAAALLALLVAPFALHSGETYGEAAQDYAGLLLEETEKLRTVAQRVSETRAEAGLAYSFAEQFMTEEIGSAQLAEGEAQYEEGRETYEAGMAQYRAGAQQLADARVQYRAGAERLAEGQAQYDAGLAEYNAAKQQLAEGQAQYDAGVAQAEAARQQLAEGQAQYDAGLAQYNAAKATFDAVSPLFQNALALQAQMQALQAQYDEAVANGDMVTAIALGAPLAAAQAAFEASGFNSLLGQYQAAQAELAAAEAQLADGKAQLDAGYAQLAEAEQQLADGKAKLDAGYAQLPEAERKLADGKAQLDAGYAELNAGGAQIDAGQNALDYAGQQLAEGEKALDEAAGQLEEGRELLAQNREDLQNSLAALDALSDDEAQLAEGLKLLRAEPALASIPQSGDALRTLDAAREALESYLARAEGQRRSARFVAPDLALAALLALLALLLAGKRATLSARLAALSALLAGAGLLFWLRRCGALSPWVLLPAALLLLTAALFAELLFRLARQTPLPAAPAPAPAAPAAPAPARPLVSAEDYSETLAGLEPEQLAAVMKAFFQSEEFRNAMQSGANQQK